MGWDAFAEKVDKMRFKAAAQRVKERAGSVDGFLEKGGLDCSACAFALENATGVSAWDKDGWEPKKVIRLAREARWPDEIDPDEAWAVWSAREFLETCAKTKSRITFSW